MDADLADFDIQAPSPSFAARILLKNMRGYIYNEIHSCDQMVFDVDVEKPKTDLSAPFSNSLQPLDNRQIIRIFVPLYNSRRYFSELDIMGSGCLQPKFIVALYRFAPHAFRSISTRTECIYGDDPTVKMVQLIDSSESSTLSSEMDESE